MSSGSGADRDEYRSLLEHLHSALQATEELPIEPSANRWLGEAQAVVADLVTDVPEVEVLAERLEHVDRLLGEIDDTGHPTAEDQLEEAIETVAKLHDRLP